MSSLPNDYAKSHVTHFKDSCDCADVLYISMFCETA
jgi:hypothetical protein